VQAYLGDIIIAVVMLLGIFFGWKRGLIKIIGGCGAVYFGIVAGRHITAAIMPWVDGLIRSAADSAGVQTYEEEILTTLLFSNTLTARIIEVVVLVFVTIVVVALLRRVARFLGNVINHTPLIGFVSRFFGAILAFLVFTAGMYAVLVWVFPLLSDIGFVASLNATVRASKILLPYVWSLGGWAWSVAAAGVALWQAQ